MPTATNKKKPVRKPTLLSLSREVSSLRARLEDLEDIRDLNAAIARNQGKPGTSWNKAKTLLGLV